MEPSFRNVILASSLFALGLGMLLRISTLSLSWSAFVFNFGPLLIVVWVLILAGLSFGARVVTGIYNEQERNEGEPAPASFVVFERIVVAVFALAITLVFAMMWGI